MSVTVELKDDETALFGYGSLLSIESLERTLGRHYTGPLYVSWLDGWRRTWDVAMPNRTFYADFPTGQVYPEHILYLNIHRSSGSCVNGILFVVNSDDLASYDKREWIYNRIDVSGELSGACVPKGRAFVYVGKQERLMRGVTTLQDAAVRNSYLEMLEVGLKEHGEDFRRQFEASTESVPQHLIIQDHSNHFLP